MGAALDVIGTVIACAAAGAVAALLRTGRQVTDVSQLVAVGIEVAFVT